MRTGPNSGDYIDWVVRNAIVMGRLVLRSGLGLELSRGLEEHDYAVLGEPIRLPNRNASELQKYRSEGEVPYMAARMQQVWRGINSDRIAYAGIVARRFTAFWVGGPQLNYLYLPVWRWRGAKYCLYVRINGAHSKKCDDAAQRE
jgi:hypothetical protein